MKDNIDKKETEIRLAINLLLDDYDLPDKAINIVFEYISELSEKSHQAQKNEIIEMIDEILKKGSIWETQPSNGWNNFIKMKKELQSLKEIIK